MIKENNENRNSEKIAMIRRMQRLGELHDDIEKLEASLSERFLKYEPFGQMLTTISMHFFHALATTYSEPIETYHIRANASLALRVAERTLKATQYSEITYDVLLAALRNYETLLTTMERDIRTRYKDLETDDGIFEYSIAEIYQNSTREQINKLIDTWKRSNESFRVSPITENQTIEDSERLEWNGSTAQFVGIIEGLSKKGYFTIPEGNNAKLIRILQKSFIVLDTNGKELTSGRLANRLNQDNHNEILKHRMDALPDPEKRSKRS